MRRPPGVNAGTRGGLTPLPMARSVTASGRWPEPAPVTWPPGKLDGDGRGAGSGVLRSAQRRLTGSALPGNLTPLAMARSVTASGRWPEPAPVTWPPGKAQASMTAGRWRQWRRRIRAAGVPRSKDGTGRVGARASLVTLPFALYVSARNPGLGACWGPSVRDAAILTTSSAGFRGSRWPEGSLRSRSRTERQTRLYESTVTRSPARHGDASW